MSDKEFQPELLVNERSTGKKILSVIIKELLNCQAFWFSVAFATKGGVATLIETLKTLETKGVPGQVLVSQYQNFTEPEALKMLLKFSNVGLRMMTRGNFHAKGYMFKTDFGRNLIVGSSNLTDNALCSNKEWNLKISALAESEIMFQSHAKFEKEYQEAVEVDTDFINQYVSIYNETRYSSRDILPISKPTALYTVRQPQVQPNQMQKQALKNLESLRNQGKNRALLVSATGTGKTYLAAFDVQKIKPKKFIFVVHRENIARQAMQSFRQLLGDSYKYGMYTGNQKDLEADYIFSTIQTLSREQHWIEVVLNTVIWPSGEFEGRAFIIRCM